MPTSAWQAALNADGDVRQGADLVEHIKNTAPWADLAVAAHVRLVELATPT